MDTILDFKYLDEKFIFLLYLYYILYYKNYFVLISKNFVFL